MKLNKELGEVKCPKCKGTGKITVKLKGIEKHGISEITDFPCSKCNSAGKLDWIENIVGVKVNPFQQILNRGTKGRWWNKV